MRAHKVTVYVTIDGDHREWAGSKLLEVAVPCEKAPGLDAYTSTELLHEVKRRLEAGGS